VQYCYTATIDIDITDGDYDDNSDFLTWTRVHLFAHRYNLKDLVTACEHRLTQLTSSELTASNCSGLYCYLLEHEFPKLPNSAYNSKLDELASAPEILAKKFMDLLGGGSNSKLRNISAQTWLEIIQITCDQINGIVGILLAAHLDLTWTIKAFMGKEFVDVSKSAGFLRLPEKALCQLLKEDGLLVAPEDDVLDACCRWLAGSPEPPKTAAGNDDPQVLQRADRVLQLVRLPMLSAKKLLEFKSHPMVGESIREFQSPLSVRGAMGDDSMCP